jgi:NAD(P)-dependent dehydrogenase (short-subunit alcohol dehydrogenase family)
MALQGTMSVDAEAFVTEVLANPAVWLARARDFSRSWVMGEPTKSMSPSDPVVNTNLTTPPVAIVTGGAQGIGLACAQTLARGGARVAIVDRNEDAIVASQTTFPDTPFAHLRLTADVTEPDDVRRAVAETRVKLGPPTILVNCAGILFPTRFMDISFEEWNSVIAVSMTGTFLFSQACLPEMIAAGFGRIVNFSSTAGKSVSTLGGAHYTAAKAGVLGLTRALAKEASGYGITVNAVCPGLIDTEMVRTQCSPEELDAYARSFPVGRLGTPKEVADLLSFLCSRDAGYITGASIDINGGDLLV